MGLPRCRWCRCGACPLSLFLLPATALGAETPATIIANAPTLMTLRWFFFMSGGIAGFLLGFGLFFAGPEGLMARAAGIRRSRYALSLIIISGGLIACLTALATRARQHAPETGPFGLRLIQELAECLRNPAFRAVLTTNVLFFVGFGVNSVLESMPIRCSGAER